MDPSFHAQRRFVSTLPGRIAYVELGKGPAPLCVHGVPVNGFHWRHVMAGVSDIRRCIALDLMGLGYTEINRSQDVSCPAQARIVARSRRDRQRGARSPRSSRPITRSGFATGATVVTDRDKVVDALVTSR